MLGDELPPTGIEPRSEQGFMLVCYGPARLLALVAEWLTSEQQYSVKQKFTPASTRSGLCHGDFDV